jgi:hypothetical protein
MQRKTQTKKLAKTLMRYGFFLGVWMGGCFPAAQANDLSVLVNGKAVHLDAPANANYNESNWGFGLQYDFTDDDKEWVPMLNASGFRDSNDNPSYYLGGGIMRRYHFSEDPKGVRAELGGIAFMMKREGFRNGDWFPGVLPAWAVGTDRVMLNMTFAPKVDPKSTAFIFFQLKIKIAEF